MAAAAAWNDGAGITLCLSGVHDYGLASLAEIPILAIGTLIWCLMTFLP